jgi:hypothetical protein
MPIFFRVKEKVFKCPDQIVIGRGAPFSVFDDNRDVARAHLLVTNKKNQLRVKFLHSNSKTLINEKPVKAGKFIKISNSDQIVIGGESIEFLSEEVKGIEVVTIERSTSLPMDTAFQLYFKLIYFILVGFIFYDHKFSFFNIVSNLFLSFLLWGAFSWIIKFYEKMAAPSMKEIYISPEGFTVHFSDHQNMTFKVENIQSWFTPKHGKTIYISAHDDEYVLNTFGHFQSLLTFLKETVPEKEIDKKSFEKNWMILLVILIVGFVSNSFVSIMACLFSSIACLMMIFSQRARSFWPQHVTKVYSIKKQKIAIVLLGFITGFMAFDKYRLRENDELVRICNLDSGDVCSRIDFREADSDDFMSQEFYKTTLVMACEMKNHSACKKIKKLRLNKI